jgi:hypothetical protein
MRGGRMVGATALVVLGLGMVGCGGASHPNRSGVYRGPNVLRFALLDPIERRMPDERNQGSAEVIDDGSEYVTLELRIFDGGETPCQIRARRIGGPALMVQPGQRCASRFRYDGAPVAAVVQINEGTVRFTDAGMRVELSGPFVADVATNRGVVTAQGIAEWELDGYR